MPRRPTTSPPRGWLTGLRPPAPPGSSDSTACGRWRCCSSSGSTSASDGWAADSSASTSSTSCPAILITGLLLAEFERRERIGLVAFWLRRARRLVPALLLVLVAVTLMVRFALPPGTVPDYRGSALSALFYVSNWWQIAASGNYFVAAGATSPLTHTWSLAVEEQFYLVWPLVVLAVLHLAGSFRRGVRWVLAVAAIGAVASAVEMAVLFRPGANTTRIYFGTDTHAQSVLVGAVLACVLTQIARRRGSTGMDPAARTPAARALLTAAGLGGLALVLAFSDVLGGGSTFAYRGGFAAGGCVRRSGHRRHRHRAWGPRGPGPVGGAPGVVGHHLLRHLPLALPGGRVSSTPVAPACTVRRCWSARTAVTVIVAAASFYLVERPVIEGRFWRTAASAGPALVAVGLTVTVVVATTPGRPPRHRPRRPDSTARRPRPPNGRPSTSPASPMPARGCGC